MKNQILSTITLISFLAATSCVTAGHSDGDRLSQIVEDFTYKAKRLDPYWATYYGVEEDLNKFGDYLSPEYFARAKKLYDDALTALSSVNPNKLSPGDLVNYRIFKSDMEVSLREFDFPVEYFSFNQMGSRLRDFIDDSSPSLSYFPFDSLKHYKDFVKRATGFPAFVDRQIDVLRRGLKAGYALNCVVAKNAVRSYEEALTDDIEKHPFYRPILNLPKKISGSDVEELKVAYQEMIKDHILPSFKKFDQFYKKEYLPQCRRDYGISTLPRGKDYYAYKIRANTDLPLSADEIHRIGLKEVQRIRGEMQKIKNQVGFKGSLNSFIKSLTVNPKYYFNSAEELFNAFRDFDTKVKAEMNKYFALIPKTDFRLVEAENSEDPAASYRMPTESREYGRFVVNTKNIKGVPTYGVQTLYAHEAIPGHHFQLALQYEMKSELSEYRRKIFDSTAFVEGWGLYSEQLLREVGLISDPMQRMGSLNDEMLRAVRLVVDTGIHHLKWSRTKAISYMRNNLASDIRDIEIEADRYSVWPGQALGYKIGQLKIAELREKAKESLGSRFNIKDFHRVVLGSGTVSLDVLESNVQAYINSM